MFERYTEQARRVIFFARYETSQFGSMEIEPEHLLLGLLREDAPLMNRFVPGASGQVREQIERENPPRAKISTNVDLPLSHSAKRVLAYGLEEAGRMIHSQIRTEHLLLGLLRAPSLAARILEARGVRLEVVREQIVRSVAAKSRTLTPEEAAAEREALHSLIASLPDDALRRTRQMLEASPVRQRILERQGQMASGYFGVGGAAGGGSLQDGHFYSCSLKDGTVICETRRHHKGHQIMLTEKLRISEDGKTLRYSQELRGPKGEHNWSKDFDLT